MADLSTHYKEINPTKTVENVKNFFNTYGLTTKVSNLEKTEIGTYACHVNLYLNDIRLSYGSNGKGVTEEYCLASGYAELYERFCNGYMFMPSPYWNKKIIEYNQEHYGYNLHPQEKILTYDELLNNSTSIKNYFDKITDGSELLTKSSLDFITEEQYIGVPFYNLQRDDIKYLDPRVVIRMTKSIGMSAGNTVEEALVQGTSELFEKEGMKLFFTKLDSPSHAIKLENITDPVLKPIIDNIKKEGYEFYLIDLSYEFEVPVMLSVLINREDGRLAINFGSFPVFEIAAERVLTELYQGIRSYKESFRTNQAFIPFKIISEQSLFRAYSNNIDGSLFPLDFFNNLIYEDTPNYNFYAKKESSNEELVDYYVKLCQKKDTSIYYIDNSLCENIHAIHVFFEGPHEYTGTEQDTYNWNGRSGTKVLKYLKDLSKLYNEMYNPNKTVDLLNLINIIRIEESFDQTVNFFLGNIVMWHNFTLTDSNGIGFYTLNSFLNENLQYMMLPEQLMNTVIGKSYKKYLELIYYLSANKYTNEELFKIFNKVYNYDLTEKDIQNGMKSSYAIEHSYVLPLKNYISSQNYENIIKAFSDATSHKK